MLIFVTKSRFADLSFTLVFSVNNDGKVPSPLSNSSGLFCNSASATSPVSANSSAALPLPGCTSLEKFIKNDVSQFQVLIHLIVFGGHGKQFSDLLTEFGGHFEGNTAHYRVFGTAAL